MIYAVFLLSIGLTYLQAQTTIIVNEKTGTQTSFLIKDVNKLTFASGNITIKKNDGSTKFYSLENLRFLNFGNVTAIDEVSNDGISKFLLYPSFVHDQISIQYSIQSTENVNIQIIDINGRVVYNQTLNCQSGINYTTISASQFTKGLYLCRLQNGNKIKTNKFIKN